MIEGIRDSAIKAGLISNTLFEKGIRDLYQTAEPEGTFC
jgi:hypothetical protein